MVIGDWFSEMDAHWCMPDWWVREQAILSNFSQLVVASFLTIAVLTTGTNCITQGPTGNIKGRKRPETTDNIAVLVDKLKQYYTPWNEKLFSLIGESFNWTMDEA